MNRKIMVIDDEPIITKTLSNLLTLMLDCDVIAYNTPREALKDIHLINQEIDVLISDFMMPEMDGFELIKAVEDLHPSCISIMLTGYSDKQSAINSINELNLYYYLEKPWVNDDLIKVVKNGFEKRALETAYGQQLVILEKNHIEINRLYDVLKEAYQVEQTINHDLIKTKESLEHDMLVRNFALQSILDHVGQGFLTFDTGMKVNKEFSMACLDIFGNDITGRDIATLLFPKDIDQQLFLHDIFQDLLCETFEAEYELLYPLLPDEIQLKQRYYSLSFIFIDKKQMQHLKDPKSTVMLVITDITAQKKLENVVEDERNKLKMVVAAVVKHREIAEVLKEYADFIERQLPELITDYKNHKEIFRKIHTFKGSFSQIGFVYTTGVLHDVENDLTKMQQRDLNDLTRVFSYNNTIDKDMEILNGYLGKGFFDQDDLIIVDKSLLLEIESDVMTHFNGDELENILAKLRKIRYRSLKALMDSYHDYVIKLSESLNKPMKALVISGDDILVDVDLYRPLIKVFYHVLRNAMDHGIESIEEREALGKAYFGSLFINIEKMASEIIFTFTNDGKEIKRTSIEKTLLNLGHRKEDINQMSNSEVLSFIFQDHFSTQDDVSLISGRGVGLSAVMSQVEQLGGSISVQSNSKNTSFQIKVPIIERTIILSDSFYDICLDALSNEVGKTFVILESTSSVTLDEAYEFYGIIEIIGQKSFEFQIKVESSCIHYLSNNLLGVDDQNLYDDLLSEYLNICSGNVLKNLPEQETLDIGIPIIGVFSDKDFKLSKTLVTEVGVIEISIFT